MICVRFFVTLAVIVVLCEGKVFTRCKLAKELMNTKVIKKTYLGNWVCLIEQVSSRNTSAYTVTLSGIKRYGLYQIPQKYCRDGKRGGLCNIACESLLDDDIKDDTVCANYIFEQEGFKFWSQWVTRCKNNDHVTTEIYKCPDFNSALSRSHQEELSHYIFASERFRRRYRRRIISANLIRENAK